KPWRPPGTGAHAMRRYIALIRKDPDTDFGVDFPDFPGCITAGRTLDEALARAPEALALHVKGMTEDGEPMPVPSSLEEIIAGPEDSEPRAAVTDLPDTKPDIARDNLNMDKRMREAVDAQAHPEGVTLSGWLGAVARAPLAAAKAPRQPSESSAA